MSCVIHPYQLHEIIDLIATGAYNANFVPQDMMSETIRQYWRGREKLFGTDVFTTGNLAINAAGDSYGAVFNKAAFLYLVGWEPDNWIEEDPSLRGWEIGIVSDYGMVEEDGTYGRYLLFAATKPTS